MLNISDESCCGCSACASKCPKHCITMKTNEEGFLYPFVDTDNCISCGICQNVCPILDVDRNQINNLREAWGARTVDKNVLLSSSSGGVFSSLAKKIINENGVVFGAAFSDDFQFVHHILIKYIDEIKVLMGSKYIQSEMGDCFFKVKRQLEMGELVLFSGTPCQIAGLKGFLGKDYDNLFCVDVICHGVPSKYVWQSYCNSIAKKTGKDIAGVNFRNKRNGWKNYGIELKMNNDNYYYCEARDDSFLRMFVNSYCLRDSCYKCEVKNNVVSDITIGDFWGVENIAPEIEDELGVSLILIHTPKGKELFEKIKNQLHALEVDYDTAIAHNTAYRDSVKKPPERDEFYVDLKELNWEKMKRKYLDGNIIKVVKRQLSNSALGKLRREIAKKF